MKHKISQRKLFAFLEMLLDNSVNLSIFNNEFINSIVNNKKQYECLLILETLGAVNLHYADNSLHFIAIKSDAYTLLYQAFNKKLENIKGFFAGIISTVVAELLIIMLINL